MNKRNPSASTSVAKHVHVNLSWNEIKDRALRFSNDWKGEKRERAEKDTFWNEFFDVFGITRRRLATFEEPVKKLNNKQGYIDLFWKGNLLVEHKSKGRSLDAAFSQATDYFHGLKEHELPKYVLVSDFEQFRLYDLEDKAQHEFHIADFHKQAKLFGFMAGYQKRKFQEQDPVNIKAAELMGKLHEQLEASGYTGHPLEIYLVRLLFCLFADDTGIFEKDTFKEYIETRTAEDGSNLGPLLAELFQVLNTPEEKRMKTLDEQLASFRYINGKLFEEQLPFAAFNRLMREMLLQCCSLNWGLISPAIFGSMFQSVMNAEERRNLGAHYTSEKNILKLIKPLFLDELRAEFEKNKKDKKQLGKFHDKLSKLKFLDPACGCGNFLIITYRELRLLELDVMKAIYGNQMAMGIQLISKVDVDQFYGIEIDEFPARISEVALWLMDHQMNLLLSEAFGEYFVRLPLRKSATIVHGNALRMDWETVVPKEELSYILGNPPFVGKHLQTKIQKLDIVESMKNVKNASDLDYVAGWYYNAAKYIVGSKIEVAFVSTNSIIQGEQVPILWQSLFDLFDIKINFAHRTFRWNNEAKGIAAVHCIIIGFASFDRKRKMLYDYELLNSEPHGVFTHRINCYLSSGPMVIISKTNVPIHSGPAMKYGNKPSDNGNYIFSPQEKEMFLQMEPGAKKFFRRYIGSYEFINNIERWCLWLKDIEPSDLKLMPKVLKRVELVRDFRLASTAAPTRKSANYATSFFYTSHPNTPYLVIPETSSEKRKYIPIGYMDKDVIASNAVYLIPFATLYTFGILCSIAHMNWTKYTCGRLKSDYRYSASIVYNNFPWPKNPTEKQKQMVETKAQQVLDARALFPNSSLADLYDPIAMPPALMKAHQELDKAVDQCYRSQPFPTESARMEYLFELYNEYTNSPKQ